MIRRAPRPETGWTTFDNRVLADRELSFRALGILVYILSKPDDWTVRTDELAASHAEGRDAVLTAMTHLEDAGYVDRRRFRNSRGHWDFECVVYDSPQDRNLGDNAHPNRVSRAGSSGSGNPGHLVRTEDEGLNTKEYTRGAARRRGTTVSRPKSRRLVQPDDDTGSDESPALGASPRASREERNERSAARGQSGYGLAIRLERGLKGQPGSAAIVDKAALASQLKRKVEAGTHTYAQLAACIEVYVGAPTRYRSGDMKGWTQFLAALPKLEKDAESMHRATAPAAEVYGGLDPYEGLR